MSPMPPLLVRSLLLALCAVSVAPRFVHTQVVSRHRTSIAAAPQPDASSQNRRNAFSINPLGIPFEIVSIELESALHDAFTLAGNFSYFSPDDFTRSSLEIKGRLYPNERAPHGFSVGIGLGGVNTRETVSLNGVDELRDTTSASRTSSTGTEI